MSWCSCGFLIASGVGDGFIVTPDGRILWMRRRSDTFSCSDCGRTYGLKELAAVSPDLGKAMAGPSGQAG